MSSEVVMRSLYSSQSKGPVPGKMREMVMTRMAETPTEKMLPVSSGGLRPVVRMEIEPLMICAQASQEAMPQALPMTAPAAQRKSVIHGGCRQQWASALLCAAACAQQCRNDC